jgi:hypothetical protein
MPYSCPTDACARTRAGCSQSRQRFESARLFDSKPDQLPLLPGSTRLGTATKYCLPKAVYRNRAGLELKNSDGNVVYKLVKNEVWEDKHCLTDPKGNKLALLRRDITFPAAHAKFVTFSYKPNFQGQESTDVDADGVAIYPFAQLRCIVPSMPPKYEYLLFKTNDLTKPELNSTINSVCSSRKRGTMTDMKDQLMLRFEEFITNKEGAGYIDVEVAAGIDPLQALIIGISIDEETTRSR